MAKKNAIEDLHTLTVDSILDYHVCELFYKYKYLDEIPEHIEASTLLSKRYENTMKKVVSFFFYKKQAEVLPSYKSLVNRWEKLWFPKDQDAYDMMLERFSPTKGNLASYSNSAIASLETFYEDFKSDPGIPIAISESYIVPLRSDIRLIGEIDLILKYGKDDYKIIKWGATKKSMREPVIGLEFSALKLAFYHRLGKPQAADYKFYDLSAVSRGFLDVDQPQQEDVNALSYWAKEIGDATEYVPRRGFTVYCKGCPFDKECKEFNSWPKIT